ncbi:nuclear transcription factor Y subunit beta-like [Microplitis mediator]|uniref:nuclear transcription factor Y subunit beta-like n=1 Tax=Microplitis mediator TaxID=375433 RepID=UPI002557B848|nr:nuclear transcription factor Y subunit beta-like [Microplitis mediator]
MGDPNGRDQQNGSLPEHYFMFRDQILGAQILNNHGGINALQDQIGLQYPGNLPGSSYPVVHQQRNTRYYLPPSASQQQFTTQASQISSVAQQKIAIRSREDFPPLPQPQSISVNQERSDAQTEQSNESTNVSDKIEQQDGPIIPKVPSDSSEQQKLVEECLSSSTQQQRIDSSITQEASSISTHQSQQEQTVQQQNRSLDQKLATTSTQQVIYPHLQHVSQSGCELGYPFYQQYGNQLVHPAYQQYIGPNGQLIHHNYQQVGPSSQVVPMTFQQQSVPSSQLIPSSVQQSGVLRSPMVGATFQQLNRMDNLKWQQSGVLPQQPQVMGNHLNNKTSEHRPQKKMYVPTNQQGNVDTKETMLEKVALLLEQSAGSEKKTDSRPNAFNNNNNNHYNNNRRFGNFQNNQCPQNCKNCQDFCAKQCNRCRISRLLLL